MNCRDVIWILDNQKGALDAAKQRDCEAHVATCADCASAWRVQASLAELPTIAFPSDLAGNCRLLVASTSPVSAGRPARGRWVLWGSFASLAAAAAVFLFFPRNQTDTPPTVSASPATAQAVAPISQAPPPAAATEAPAAVPPAIAVEVPAPPHFLVRVLPPPSSANAGGTPDALQAAAQDPTKRQTADAVRTALIEQLRTIPGLILVESDLAQVEPTSSRKYQLRVGGMTLVGPDGRPVPPSSRLVEVLLTAEQFRSNGKNVNRLRHSVAVDPQSLCTGATTVASGPACYDPQEAAAAMVSKLRLEVFPPDPAVIRGLQAQLQDASQGMAQRSKILFDLLKIQENTGDPSLLRNPGVVRAAIDLAASSSSDMRARIWRAMRGVGSMDLIQPLMNSLSNDPAEVCLAALETLADFRTDARVRSTLESVALGDSRPLVRAVAERGLSGEEPWRQYVVTSLKDTARPAAARTEALMYYLYPPGSGQYDTSHPDYWQVMQEMLDDDAATALAQALPAAGSMRGHANNILGNFAPRHTRNPAVTEMLLTIVQTDTRPVMRSVAGEVLARMHSADPRVRAVLDKVIQSDPDPSVRNYVRERIPPARSP
jgi:hypothetical protein